MQFYKCSSTKYSCTIEFKKMKLSQFQNKLNSERVLLTPELISDREIEIKDYANEVIALQEKRFGPRVDSATTLLNV